MNAQSPEGNASHEPTERRKKGGELSSQDLLDELMEGPRMWADTINGLITERFPTGGRDLQKANPEEKTAKDIDALLRRYREEWLTPHLAKTNKKQQAIVASALEPLSPQSELSFHIISRLIIPQWYRVLVATKSPKTNNFHPETVQIRLAMESAKLIAAKKESNQPEFYDSALNDIDGMTSLLQLVIDDEKYDLNRLIVAPHPEIGRQNRSADFLIFERQYNDSFEKIEVKSEDILDPSLAPGSVAVNVLKNIRFQTISRRPDFQVKGMLGEVMVARERVRDFNQETHQDVRPVEDSTRRIGSWLLEKIETSNEISE